MKPITEFDGELQLPPEECASVFPDGFNSFRRIKAAEYPLCCRPYGLENASMLRTCQADYARHNKPSAKAILATRNHYHGGALPTMSGRASQESAEWGGLVETKVCPAGLGN